MTTESVTLLPSAAAFLRDQLQQRGYGIGMRLSVKATGCSGYKYLIDYVDEPREQDHVFPINDAQGLSLFVDAKSFPFLKGTMVDVATNGLSKQWVFHNPNEEGHCGCGESFNVKESS